MSGTMCNQAAGGKKKSGAKRPLNAWMKFWMAYQKKHAGTKPVTALMKDAAAAYKASKK